MQLAGLVVAALGALVVCLPPANAQTVRAMVSVFDEKTGHPVTGLQAKNFSVVDDKVNLRIDSAEYKTALLDVMLLIDASLMGETVRPLAAAMIENLHDRDQMAVVAFHESAELLQDFTNSKQVLLQALQGLRYGNNPRVLDALYAAIDGGFTVSAGRKVMVVLSAGVEGFSRVPEAEVIRLARSKGVSIFPVYVVGAERRLFRLLAERTGGAYFEARKLKLEPDALSRLLYSALRGYYELEMSGVFRFGLEPEVEIVGPPGSNGKIRATLLPLE